MGGKTIMRLLIVLGMLILIFFALVHPIHAITNSFGFVADDRVVDDPDAPVFVFRPQVDPNVIIEVWRHIYEEGRAELILTVSPAQLAAVPTHPATVTQITSTPDGHVSVSRLPNGQCRVSADRFGFLPYILDFDCPVVAGQIAVQPALPAVTTITTPPSVPTTGETYIVRTGDTLSRIARRFGVSLSALAAANHITNPNRIFVGMALVIPGQTKVTEPAQVTTPPVTAGEHTHVVASGENLFRISLRYGVSIEAMMQANHISNPNRIFVGQVLVIP